MNTRRAIALSVTFALACGPLTAYPIDGEAGSGIRRLAGYRDASGAIVKLAPGARLGIEEIRLQLDDTNATWDPADRAKDPVLQAAIDSIFAARDPSYAVTVIDITDPEAIAWAGRRENSTQSPGSVNKILCMAALFDGLRRAFPEPAARERVLRETVVEATDWVLVDEHVVPHWDVEAGVNRSRIIRPGDRFRLSEWVDHMVSASANSAGAVVWKEAMLLRRFGAAYPPSAADEAAFFKETPRAELTRLSQQVIDEPLAAAGLNLDSLRQGSMWTRTGKAKIPGLSSFASPRELARFLLRIEQGRLVDGWSSLEMKRYLYMTKRRYRYVYAPELARAAVYFKSGSLYQCVAEEGYSCGKYRGNAKNFMNSVAIVESPAERGEGQRRYIVALMSNVLRTNSAWDHSRIAAAIDEAVRTRKPVTVRDGGSSKEIDESGRGD